MIALVGATAALPLADKPQGAPVYGPGPRPARAAPAPYAPPPPAYSKPSPYKEKELPPQPYQFEYGVNDQYSGAAFQAAESQSDKGEVYGKS